VVTTWSDIISVLLFVIFSFDSQFQQHANNVTPYVHLWTNASFKGLFVAQKLGNL
jgi:hypothetical protein